MAEKLVKPLETLEAFEKLISETKDQLIVVDFWADWCGPCKMIAPKIEAMAKEFTDVIFAKVNVDDNDDTATKNEISAMPTFIFFKNGEKVETVVGASEAKIKEAVNRLK